MAPEALSLSGWPRSLSEECEGERALTLKSVVASLRCQLPGVELRGPLWHRLGDQADTRGDMSPPPVETTPHGPTTTPPALERTPRVQVRGLAW